MAVEQPQKDQRERYASVVRSMTLRTLHEVFEADHGGKIATISLVGSVAHVDSATGRDTETLLIAVAVDRPSFEALDLHRIDSIETLRHLGAVVSKNPHGLTPIPAAHGVRAH